MITADTLFQGMTGQRQEGLIPSIFDDVEPIDFIQIGSSNCEEFVNDGLTTIGVGTPRNPAMAQWFNMYIQAGCKKASPQDFRNREDGSPGCQMLWSEPDQGYVDGDIILLVVDKRIKRGWDMKAFVDANYPTWSKDQRERVKDRVTPRARARAAALDETSVNLKGGTKMVRTDLKDKKEIQAYNVKDKKD